MFSFEYRTHFRQTVAEFAAEPWEAKFQYRLIGKLNEEKVEADKKRAEFYGKA